MGLTERALDEYTREEHRSSRMKNENDKLASFMLQGKSSGVEIKRYIFISPMDNDINKNWQIKQGHIILSFDSC